MPLSGKFSRRRLLGSAAGLGASLWVPRLALAQADPHAGHGMNMSATLGQVARQRPPDSTSSGTSNTSAGAPWTAAAWRSVSRPIKG